MRIGMRRFSRLVSMRAPAITGAVLCAAIALATLSCRKNPSTPDWDTAGDATATEVRPTPTTTSPPASSHRKKPQTQPPGPSRSAKTPSAGSLRFAAYNVENWLTMDRFTDNQQLTNAPKPAAEKQAVIRLLVKHSPDVIGLCEIGQASDLAEIQQSLKTAGLYLPHSYYTGGSDPIRHLGFLSRFPITSRAKPAETEFHLRGRTFGINRGILDATITARGKSYRFLGVHLKSKRQVEEADQEQMRIHEARLLRRHVDAILQADPRARLIVYGDFNDTRPSKAFKTVTGSYNDPGYLTAIPFKDSRGEAWTHHWALHDIYSRIDFVTVTRALRPEVDFEGSYLIDDPGWDQASDHRPMLAIFK